MVDRITSKNIDEINKKAKEVFNSIGHGVYPHISRRYEYYAIDIHTKEGFGVERTYRSGYTAGEAYRVVEGMIRGAQAHEERFMWGGSKFKLSKLLGGKKCGKGWHGNRPGHKWAAMGYKMKGKGKGDYTPHLPIIGDSLTQYGKLMPDAYHLSKLPDDAYTSFDISESKWNQLARTGKYMIYTQVDAGMTRVYSKGWRFVNRTGVYALVPVTHISFSHKIRKNMGGYKSTFGRNIESFRGGGGNDTRVKIDGKTYYANVDHMGALHIWTKNDYEKRKEATWYFQDFGEMKESNNLSGDETEAVEFLKGAGALNHA